MNEDELKLPEIFSHLYFDRDEFYSKKYLNNYLDDCFRTIPTRVRWVCEGKTLKVSFWHRGSQYGARVEFHKSLPGNLKDLGSLDYIEADELVRKVTRLVFHLTDVHNRVVQA